MPTSSLRIVEGSCVEVRAHHQRIELKVRIRVRYAETQENKQGSPPLKDHEVEEIVRTAMNSIKSEDPLKQEGVKQHVRAMAVRNMKSKVPAVRKVAAEIMDRMSEETKNNRKIAKRAAVTIWKR